jgi:hypothetical protein
MDGSVTTRDESLFGSVEKQLERLPQFVDANLLPLATD